MSEASRQGLCLRCRFLIVDWYLERMKKLVMTRGRVVALDAALSGQLETAKGRVAGGAVGV